MGEGNPYRQEKIAGMIMRLAAEYIAEEAARETMITPTRVLLSPDRSRATIYITVFPEKGEESAFHFLRRRRSEFKHFVKKKTKIGRIPHMDFVIDEGAKNALEINEISKKVL